LQIWPVYVTNSSTSSQVLRAAVSSLLYFYKDSLLITVPLDTLYKNEPLKLLLLLVLEKLELVSRIFLFNKAFEFPPCFCKIGPKYLSFIIWFNVGMTTLWHAKTLYIPYSYFSSILENSSLSTKLSLNEEVVYSNCYFEFFCYLDYLLELPAVVDILILPIKSLFLILLLISVKF
jgi:hypothetical protein